MVLWFVQNVNQNYKGSEKMSIFQHYKCKKCGNGNFEIFFNINRTKVRIRCQNCKKNLDRKCAV